MKNDFEKNIYDYMDIAYKKAKESVIKNPLDIPVCALIEKNGEIISIQTNRREKDKQTIAHAEILAINEANKKLANWRLEGCNMYVTLEPCPMCGWAIINARIENLYFGSYDTNYGAFLSVLSLLQTAKSKMKVYGGIKEKECNRLLGGYFEKLRNN